MPRRILIEIKVHDDSTLTSDDIENAAYGDLGSRCTDITSWTTLTEDLPPASAGPTSVKIPSPAATITFEENGRMAVTGGGSATVEVLPGGGGYRIHAYSPDGTGHATVVLGPVNDRRHFRATIVGGGGGSPGYGWSSSAFARGGGSGNHAPS